MTGVDAHVVKFQCPNCGHELEQTIGQIKSSEHMRCPGCGVGINIDANRLATLAEMVGTTRSRVSQFMNKFRKLGFIDYNGHLEVHSSLLSVVLHD